MNTTSKTDVYKNNNKNFATALLQVMVVLFRPVYGLWRRIFTQSGLLNVIS